MGDDARKISQIFPIRAGIQHSRRPHPLDRLADEIIFRGPAAATTRGLGTGRRAFRFGRTPASRTCLRSGWSIGPARVNNEPLPHLTGGAGTNAPAWINYRLWQQRK